MLLSQMFVFVSGACKVNNADWYFITEEGKTEYSPTDAEHNFFDKGKGRFIVWYASSKLDEEDYVLDTDYNKLTLNFEPLAGSKITVSYVGN